MALFSWLALSTCYLVVAVDAQPRLVRVRVHARAPSPGSTCILFLEQLVAFGLRLVVDLRDDGGAARLLHYLRGECIKQDNDLKYTRCTKKETSQTVQNEMRRISKDELS